MALALGEGSIKCYRLVFDDDYKLITLPLQWTPYDGKPVSDLLFLDDCVNSDGSKYTIVVFDILTKLLIYILKPSRGISPGHALTISEDKTQLKIWSCDSWKCQETINFYAADNESLAITAQKTESSHYIMLIESRRRAIYIMEMLKPENNSSEILTRSNGSTSIKSIAEYSYPASVLSTAFVNATIQHFECVDTGKKLKTNDVVIHLILVQSENIQECHMVYKPTLIIQPKMSTLRLGVNEFSGSNKTSSNEVIVKGSSSNKEMNSLDYINTNGFRGTSSLVYVISEKSLYVGKGSRNECKTFVCYQTVLNGKDKKQNQCSARITIDKNDVCKRNKVQHSTHPNHENLFRDMETANSMKGLCKQLQELLGSSARKISTREIFNKKLAT